MHELSQQIRRTTPHVIRWIEAAAIIVLATFTAEGLSAIGLSDVNVIMTYLLGVVTVAWRCGRAPAIVASLFSVVLYNFFFVEPRYSLLVDDTDAIYEFTVMLLVAMLISTLNAQIKAHRFDEVILRVTRRLGSATGWQRIAALAQEEFAQGLGGAVRISLLPEQGNHTTLPVVSQSGELQEEQAQQAAFTSRQTTGISCPAFAEARGLFLPLQTEHRCFGVLAWWPRRRRNAETPELRSLAEAFAQQLALMLERDFLAREAQAAQAQIEIEKRHSSLLSSVSHDLRTPLSAIAGSAATLLAGHAPDSSQQRALLGAIQAEAQRMERLVENLLTMSRAEHAAAGMIRDWHPLDEVVTAALNRTLRKSAFHEVQVSLAGDIPPISMDALLIEQVLVNLLENAEAYAPPHSPIHVEACRNGPELLVSVRDQGPGVPPEDRQRIFEKFYRGAAARISHRGGAGLGLAICRAIVLAHQGRIWYEENPGGGSKLCFTLPLVEIPAVQV